MGKDFVEDIDIIDQKENRPIQNEHDGDVCLMNRLRQERMTRGVRKLFCLILLKKMFWGGK